MSNNGSGKDSNPWATWGVVTIVVALIVGLLWVANRLATQNVKTLLKTPAKSVIGYTTATAVNPLKKAGTAPKASAFRRKTIRA